MTDKLKKKDYEKALEKLQLELNTLHAWLAATGERLLVILEGRDTAGKTGLINALSDRLNRAGCASSPCPSPPNTNRRSGISSVTCNTCRRRANWCCSTAAGTTAPASRR